MTRLRHLAAAAIATSALLPLAFTTQAAAQEAPATPVASATAAPVAVPAPAPTPTPTPAPASSNSTFDDIWGVTRLYRNSDADFLNELRIVGRLHLDNYVVDSNVGNDNDFVARRARIGLRGRVLHDLEFHVQGDFNLEGGPDYNRLTDAYLAWHFSDEAIVTVGKHGAKFTLDGATSSNEIITLERSTVTQNLWFTDQYIPGVSFNGESDGWTYTVGVFSSGRRNRDFGHFDGGAFVLASLGRDVSSALGVKSAEVRVDYVYQDPNPRNSFTRPFQHVGALVFSMEEDNWGLDAELAAGDGYGAQGDVFGTTIRPWVRVADNLQLVTRYSYLNSSGNNGLRFSRYENTVVNGRGDEYQDVYAGLNYLIYGNRLRVMSGLTYAHMRDRAADGGAYDGIAWTTGLRISW